MHIKENQHEIYEKQIVPPILDSILKIKIEKKEGDGDKIENILKFSLNISPNVIKDKGIFEIIIPEKEKN